MRTATLILFIILLSGCATAGEKCLGYGFKAGTEGLANCAMREDQARRNRVSNSLNSFADRQQRSFDSFNRNYGNAFRSERPTLNCYHSPDFGAGTTTTCN